MKHERDADAAGNRRETAIHRGAEEGGGKYWEMIGGQEQDLETASPRLTIVNMRELRSVMLCRMLYKNYCRVA